MRLPAHLNQKVIPVAVFPLMIMASAMVARALPSNEVTTLYYSDANKTQVVGGRILLCSGEKGSWGRSTQYISRESEPCRPSRPPQTSNPPCEFLAKGCSSLPSTRF